MEISISESGFDALARFIANSFHRDGEAKAVALQKGLYGDAQFYRGVGKFYLMNTCNKWTAKGLQSAGVDIIPTARIYDSLGDSQDGLNVIL